MMVLPGSAPVSMPASTASFMALLMAAPAFWYSIWFLKSPNLISPVASRRSVPLIAGPVCTPDLVSPAMPSTATL